MTEDASHGISTVRELKAAIRDYPDEAYVSALLLRDGKPYSTLALTQFNFTPGRPGAPATVQLEVIEGHG
jgi:hypothetical protein